MATFKSLQAGSASHLRITGDVAGAISGGLTVASVVVRVVHDLVRDAISDVIGKLASKVAIGVLTAGLAAPWAVSTAITEVSSWVTRLSKEVTDTVLSARNLKDLLSKANRLFDDVGTAFARMASQVGESAAKRVDDLARSAQHRIERLGDFLTNPQYALAGAPGISMRQAGDMRRAKPTIHRPSKGPTPPKTPRPNPNEGRWGVKLDDAASTAKSASKATDAAADGAKGAASAAGAAATSTKRAGNAADAAADGAKNAEHAADAAADGAKHTDEATKANAHERADADNSAATGEGTTQWDDPAKVQEWYDELPTKTRTASTEAYHYQHRVLETDVERQLTADNGDTVWADSVTTDGTITKAWDAKHTGGGHSALYQGKGPEFLMKKFDDEMRVYGEVIRSSGNPVSSLTLVTNTPESLEFLGQRAREILGPDVELHIQLKP